jgi:protein-S-isoprenylcysteine O-methyltransferase Ste14
MDVLTAAGRFIASCWVVFFAVWFIAAWFAKRTVKRSGTWPLSIAGIAAILVIAAATGSRSPARPAVFWHASAGIAAAGAAITAAGLAVALWARVTLGRNWSGVIVLKDRHELIDRGPYAFVRHPIYTGVLLMVLGSAVFLGTSGGATVFAVVFAGLIVKARSEERWLTRHFPDTYPRYRARVRGRLVPFVL